MVITSAIRQSMAVEQLIQLILCRFLLIIMSKLIMLLLQQQILKKGVQYVLKI